MKWIDPKIQMPTLGQDVLVYVKTNLYNRNYITIAYFCEDEKMWWSTDTGSIEDHNFWVSRWMPLPKMPE
jgi:hypothetical protein